MNSLPKIKLPSESIQGINALKEIMPHIEHLLRIIERNGVDVEELKRDYYEYKDKILKIGEEYG